MERRRSTRTSESASPDTAPPVAGKRRRTPTSSPPGTTSSFQSAAPNVPRSTSGKPRSSSSTSSASASRSPSTRGWRLVIAGSAAAHRRSMLSEAPRAIPLVSSCKLGRETLAGGKPGLHALKGGGGEGQGGYDVSRISRKHCVIVGSPGSATGWGVEDTSANGKKKPEGSVSGCCVRLRVVRVPHVPGGSAGVPALHGAHLHEASGRATSLVRCSLRGVSISHRQVQVQAFTHIHLLARSVWVADRLTRHSLFKATDLLTRFARLLACSLARSLACSLPTQYTPSLTQRLQPSPHPSLPSPSPQAPW